MVWHVRLADQAELDLLDMTIWTAENFGSRQADDYAETITLAINAEGQLFWNNAPVTQAELAGRFVTASQKKPLPELQLRADKSTRYEVIAQVMAAAQNNGMTKIGFVTEPKAADN